MRELSQFELTSVSGGGGTETIEVIGQRSSGDADGAILTPGAVPIILRALGPLKNPGINVTVGPVTTPPPVPVTLSGGATVRLNSQYNISVMATMRW